MKKILFVFLLFKCIIFNIHAGNSNGNVLFQNVNRNFKENSPVSFSLFHQTSFRKTSPNSDGINQAVFMDLDAEKLRDLFLTAPTTIEFIIPNPLGEGNWKLELYKTQILSKDFKIKTSDGRTIEAPTAHYYQGVFNNDSNSIAVISVFEHELNGIMSNSSGNYDLGLFGNAAVNNYVIYRSNELAAKIPFECHTDDVNIPAPTAAVVADCRIVKVYIECDFDLYTKRSSSIANVNSFVTGFFNQVASIYTNENVLIQISEIYVWTSADPFISQTTSSAVLTAFRTTRTTFNGNIAHLISTRSSNLGGIAYLDVLCNNSSSHAFSNIYNSYSNFPTYSWTVNVFAHEMGHNLGSNHTQWCGWTGGALDNCYTTEGGCAAGPAPVGGGTIMSYCHLVSSVGVNLSNGFGQQPGDKIRLRYSAATCLSGGLTLTISPATASICSGGSIALTATGGSSFSWTPTTGLNVSNVASVIASPLANTTYTVTSTSNNCTASASRLVTVLLPVNRGTIASGNQTFTTSGDPSIISLSSGASGGNGTFSYQWYSKAGIQTAPSGSLTTGWSLISGATSSTYDPGVQSASISYSVTVDPTGTNDCGIAEWAIGVRQITINSLIAFNAGALATGNQTFCNSGGDPSLISFYTSASGATSYTYKWYYQNGIQSAPVGSSVGSWILITGATSNSYDPPAGLIQSRSYACLVTPAGAAAIWASGVRQITILPVFNPGAVTSGDQTFCASGNPSNITLSLNPSGSGAYSWRWYYKESSASVCPTGSSITGWLTNSTSANITGTTLTGAGISFDPISAGALNSGRTFAVFITPIANGSIPACGTAQWTSNCRKTYVTACIASGITAKESKLDELVNASLGFIYPNPNQSLASIPYSLPESMKGAEIVVYDQLGRRVQTWNLLPGSNMELDWNGESLTQGTYYYSLEFEGVKLDSKRMVLIR